MKNRFNIFEFPKNKFIILIVTLSLLKCLLIYLFYEWAVVTPNNIYFGYIPDAVSFEQLAKNIISGHGFSESSKEPFMPSMFKEPVYPLFIALVYLIFGPFFKYIVILQVLFNPSIAILVYLIGRAMFSERIARFSAFLVCLTPIFGEASLYIQTESFCIPLLLLAVYLIVIAFKKDCGIYYFFAAMALGVITLCRAAFLLSPVFFIILIILGYGKNLRFHKFKPFKSVIKKVPVFILGFFLVISPWIIRNKLRFNSYQIRITSGETIWAQAKSAEDFTDRQVKACLLYIFSGRLAQKYFPDFIGNDLGEFEYRYIGKAAIQKSTGPSIGDGQLDSILLREGFEIIRAHPFKYLRISCIFYLQIFKYFLPWAISYYGSGYLIFNKVIFPAIRFLFSFPLGILFTLSAVLGIFFSRRKMSRYLPLLLVIGYYNSIMFFFNVGFAGVRRFILIIVPLYYFFVSIFILRTCRFKYANRRAL